LNSGRLSCLAAALGMAASLLIQLPGPIALADGSPDGPAPRSFLGLASDPTGDILLFGGYGESADDPFLGDTWTWDGVTWRELRPDSSPRARSAMGMTYDAVREEVVLFGGVTLGHVFADTWTWDGENWTRERPSRSPSGRINMGMAYDEARGEVVLFGGENRSGVRLDDTWTWDGSTWTRRRPARAPRARDYPAMAYDGAGRQVLLFGGAYGCFEWECPHAATWSWDGTTWNLERVDESPRARWASAMAPHAPQREVVLFGGVNGYEAFGGTWTWDGDGWSKTRPSPSPSARFGLGLAYHSRSQTVVLFGGTRSLDLLGDTWVWDGVAWTEH
jgi:hypothetical protein